VITTVYFREGPPEKYQTTGRVDSTDGSTGKKRTDEKVILCTRTSRWSTTGATSPHRAPATDGVFVSSPSAAQTPARRCSGNVSDLHGAIAARARTEGDPRTRGEQSREPTASMRSATFGSRAAPA
jgi:hypothetical protein